MQLLVHNIMDRPVGRTVTRSSLEQEIWSTNLARGQIGHSIGNGSPPLRNFFEKSKLRCPGAMRQRWTPQTRYTLRRNTASTTKDLI